MHSGTERLGGGAYERPFLVLFTTDAAGRLARAEWFDAEGDAQALARFDALTRAPAARRRVRANSATRGFERFAAALAARDGAALAQLFDDSLCVVHHPSGVTYGRREMLATWRSALKAGRLDFRQETLASLGDTLALDRHVTSVEGMTEADFAEVGLAEFDEISLIQADERARFLHVEIFAADRLGEAITRLYQRYAELLPEGSARNRAAAVAQHVATVGPTARDASHLDRLAELVAPDFEGIDHRHLSTWSARGADAYLEHLRALDRVATDLAFRQCDLLALEPAALLTRCLHSGIERIGGGTYERPFLSLFAYDDAGLLARAEWFDDDREAEALARFEEIAGGASEFLASPLLTKEGARGRLLTRHFETSPDPSLVRRGTPAEPFANAASRTDSELFRCFNGRDWEGVLACVAPVMVFDERRRLVRNTCERDVWLEQFRFLYDVPNSRFTSILRATRGERLALTFHRFEGEVAEGGGPLAMEDHLALHEVDADGRIVGLVLFDLEDEEAAHAELDARFEAGEASAYPRLTMGLETNRFLQARDWRAYAARLAPGFVFRDHRRLGWGDAGLDSETLIRIQQSAFDLSPDARYRADHVRLSARGILRQATLLGTRDGGAFENPMFIVAEVDEQGRVASTDTYDIEDRHGALARFAELAAPAAYSQSRFANAATATADPVIACMVAHDWQRFEQLFAQNFRMSDRRRVVQLELDRDQYVAFTREVANGRSLRGDSQVLATRGDRLALNRSTFVFMDTDVGPSEIAFLILTEVDARGRIVAYVRWDLDDLDAACAELDARWTAGEALAHPLASKWLADYLRFFAARDWNAMSTLFVPELVGENHRLVGWGTLHGPAAVVSTLQAQIELAPDTQERVDHVRTCEHAVLFEYAWHGTHAGGAFENLWLVLVELDADGRGRRADVWEAEQLDQALARFAELAAPTRAESPFENTASRAWREVSVALQERDAGRFAALHPPAFRYRDHRRLVQLDLDRDGYLAFVRPLLEMRSTNAALELLATRGERLALLRPTLEIADDSAGPSAVESLLLIETDERGAILGYDRYEVDDEVAARAEIQARWWAGEGAARAHAAAWNVGFDAAVERRDWDAAATFFAPAFVGHDHRLVSWGTLHGPAGFLVAVQTLVELAPDVRARTQHLRASGRALLLDKVWSGTRDGGAFENPFLGVVELDGSGRAIRMDVYDPHHLDRARARFAEVGAEPNPLTPFPAREGGTDRVPPASRSGRGPLAAIVKPTRRT